MAKIRLARKEFNRAKYHKAVKELDITEEMEQFTDEYRDFVMERFNLAKNVSAHAILLLEQRLDFSKFVPEGFGTGGAVIIADGTVEIIDLKYGKEVEAQAWARAEDNPQLKLYALGALTEFDYLYCLERVKMTIYQPHTDNLCSCEMGRRIYYNGQTQRYCQRRKRQIVVQRNFVWVSTVMMVFARQDPSAEPIQIKI